MTAPFTPAFEASLKGAVQGGKLRIDGMHVVYPRYHCCLSGTSVGVDKDPTAIIRAEVQEVCEGAPFCVDILASYHATGTIVSYSLDWGDGNVTNGAWPPGGDLCHPLGGWLLWGIYEVELTLTDLLGATGTAAIEVTVMECVEVAPPLLLGTGASGPYYMGDVSVATVVPVDHASLTVPGALTANSMRVYNYPDGRQSVFMLTNCGIYEYQYLPVPTGKWQYLVTTADIFAAIGMAGTLYMDGNIEMDPLTPGRGWCSVGLITGVAPAFVHHCYLMVTQDYWSTFSIFTVATGVLGANEQPKFAVAPHSNGQIIYYRVNRWGVPPNSVIAKSTNGGSVWVTVDTSAGPNQGAVGIPWYSPGWSDDNIYVGGNGYLRYSTDQGSSWAFSAVSPRRVVDMQNPSQRYDLCHMASYDGIEEFEVGVGLTHLYTHAAADDAYAFLVIGRDANWSASDVIVGGFSGLTGTCLYRWQAGIGQTLIHNDLATQTGGDAVRAIAHLTFAGTEWP